VIDLDSLAYDNYKASDDFLGDMGELAEIHEVCS
jgi:hypothetical protein